MVFKIAREEKTKCIVVKMLHLIIEIDLNMTNCANLFMYQFSCILNSILIDQRCEHSVRPPGYFTSPNYPSPYRQGSQCEWFVQAEQIE